MAKFDPVIRGGTATTAVDVFRTDVGVRDGRIVALAAHPPAEKREIDATGLLVLPGGVDAHCHLDQPTGDESVTAGDLESGAYEALKLNDRHTRVPGWPVTTISRGEVVWSDGKLDAAVGRGQFLACGPSQSVPTLSRREA